MPGRADGILGPLTKAAIKAFKEDQNLDPDIQADEKLLVELQKQVRKESSTKSNSKIRLQLKKAQVPVFM